MEALFTSTLLVAIAEMGDKTQLLAIMLATRFRKPMPIIWGILFATLANHALAAWGGMVLAGVLEGRWFRYLIALSFFAMAFWALIPDKMDGDEDQRGVKNAGAFLTTLVAFFLVEMGDKTQVATIALGARFHDVLWVTMGTTLGMMLANVPAVIFGEAIAKRIPMAIMHKVAAGLFLLLGLWALSDALGWA